MKEWISRSVAILALLLVPMVAAPQLAYAADTPSCGEAESAKGQVLQGIGQTGNDCSDAGISKAVKTVVNVLTLIVGITAIIMIIISGFRFIISNGDSGKVASARTALIFSLVGVAVAALAQVLVRFVLFQTNK